jgi:hypothetical protein
LLVNIIDFFFFLESSGRLIGLIDVIKKNILTWHGEYGQKVSYTPIEENTKQWESLCKVRESLIGDLADMDESIADIVLNSDGIDNFDSDILLSAIRRVCITQVCFIQCFYSGLLNICILLNLLF